MLVDTSAWIEYLRGTGSPVATRLRSAIGEQERVGTTDVVVMELLSGARDRSHLTSLRRLLYRFELLPVGGLATYEQAAELHRTCRRRGETVRKLTDCLIAAVALRDDAAVLHVDRDFDVLARHTGLRVEPVAS